MDCPLPTTSVSARSTPGPTSPSSSRPGWIRAPGPGSPVFGGVTNTVPDGWANADDWAESFELVPVSEPLNTEPTGAGRSVSTRSQAR